MGMPNQNPNVDLSQLQTHLKPTLSLCQHWFYLHIPSVDYAGYKILQLTLRGSRFRLGPGQKVSELRPWVQEESSIPLALAFKSKRERRKIGSVSTGNTLLKGRYCWCLHVINIWCFLPQIHTINLCLLIFCWRQTSFPRWVLFLYEQKVIRAGGPVGGGACGEREWVELCVFVCEQKDYTEGITQSWLRAAA